MELDAKPHVALNAAVRSSGDGSGILYLKCEKSVIANMREQKRGTEGSKTFVFEVRSGEEKKLQQHCFVPLTSPLNVQSVVLDSL